MPAKMMPGATGGRRGVRRPRAARREARRQRPHARASAPSSWVTTAPASATSGMKMKRAQEMGWASPHLHLPEDATQADLVAAIRRFNDADDVDAFLVQHPVPPQLDYDAALLEMDPDKDVDGMHPVNMGRLALMMPGPAPCTPAGIEALLAFYERPGGGPRGVHPRARHHARPPARAAPLAEAADRERRGHRRAHRRPRLAALHAAGRHRDRRRRRARDPAARAHHARRGRRRRRRALRGPPAAPRRRRARARRSRARSPRGSAASVPPPSPCSSATRSRPPSDAPASPARERGRPGQPARRAATRPGARRRLRHAAVDLPAVRRRRRAGRRALPRVQHVARRESVAGPGRSAAGCCGCGRRPCSRSTSSRSRSSRSVPA